MDNLTKKQRAEVVELLRCAADLCNIDSSHGLYSVARLMGYHTWDSAAAVAADDEQARMFALVWHQACLARNHVHGDGYWYGYWHECLEAAQRVEEGSWP